MNLLDIFRRKNDPNQAPLPPLQRPAPVTQPVKPVPAPASDDKVLIIDVAHFQEGIRWKDVIAGGVKAAILKATDGESGTDPMFHTFRQQAKDVGLIVGCYCFGRFWADPIKQADHFLEVTGGVQGGELPLSIDYEWDNSTESKDKFEEKYSDGGQADDFTDKHVLAGLDYLKAKTGITPILYTAPGFFTGDNPRFCTYPLWINDFHAKTLAEVRTMKQWQRPLIWQFAEKAAFGVSGVDFNYFLGDLNKLNSMVKK